MADEIVEYCSNRPTRSASLREIKVYPVPRGGVYAMLLAMSCSQQYPLVPVIDPDDADVIVDDIVDSGETRKKYSGRPFFALVRKDWSDEEKGRWYLFPWEVMNEEVGPEENIRRIIQHIGDDPTREGLLETPSRVVKSYRELFSGYRYKTDADIKSVLKVFEDGACDEMVTLKGIDFVSYCEHHMLAFPGVAHIAYIPNGRVVGVSKLARILDIYSKRLQIQERLTQQVTAALDKYLQPKGSACVIEARHTCMCYRGVGKQNSVMMTSSLTGDFKEPATRAEFFSKIRG